MPWHDNWEFWHGWLHFIPVVQGHDIRKINKQVEVHMEHTYKQHKEACFTIIAVMGRIQFNKVWRVPETYISGFLECDKLVDMHACAEKRG